MSSEKPSIFLDRSQKQWIAIFTTLYAALAIAALWPRNEWNNITQTPVNAHATTEEWSVQKTTKEIILDKAVIFLEKMDAKEARGEKLTPEERRLYDDALASIRIDQIAAELPYPKSVNDKTTLDRLYDSLQKPTTDIDSWKETIASQQKTNEEIYAMFKQKIEKDPNYTPTDVEIMALAKLWIGVVGKKDGGGSIPFEWDGRWNDNKEKK